MPTRPAARSTSSRTASAASATPQWKEQQFELLRRAVGEDDLPHVAAALAAGISDRGQHFERGLDWLLAGIAADVESRLH